MMTTVASTTTILRQRRRSNKTIPLIVVLLILSIMMDLSTTLVSASAAENPEHQGPSATEVLERARQELFSAEERDRLPTFDYNGPGWKKQLPESVIIGTDVNQARSLLMSNDPVAVERRSAGTAPPPESQYGSVNFMNQVYLCTGREKYIDIYHRMSVADFDVFSKSLDSVGAFFEVTSNPQHTFVALGKILGSVSWQQGDYEGRFVHLKVVVQYRPQILEQLDFGDVKVFIPRVGTLVFPVKGQSIENPYRLKPITMPNETTVVDPSGNLVHPIFVYNPHDTPLSLKSVEFTSSESVHIMITGPENQHDNDPILKKNWEIQPHSYSQLLGRFVFATDRRGAKAEGFVRMDFGSQVTVFFWFNCSLQERKSLDMNLGVLQPTDGTERIHSFHMVDSLGKPLAAEDAFIVEGVGIESESAAVKSAATLRLPKSRRGFAGLGVGSEAVSATAPKRKNDAHPTYFKGRNQHPPATVGGENAAASVDKCVRVIVPRSLPHEREYTVSIGITPKLCSAIAKVSTNDPHLVSFTVRVITNSSEASNTHEMDVNVKALLLAGELKPKFGSRSDSAWIFSGVNPSHIYNLTVESTFNVAQEFSSPNMEDTFLEKVIGSRQEYSTMNGLVGMTLGQFSIDKTKLPDPSATVTATGSSSSSGSARNLRPTSPLFASSVEIPVKLSQKVSDVKVLDSRVHSVGYKFPIPIVAVMRPLLITHATKPSSTSPGINSPSVTGGANNNDEAAMMDEAAILEEEESLLMSLQNGDFADIARRVGPNTAASSNTNGGQSGGLDDFLNSAWFVNENTRGVFLNINRHATSAHFGVFQEEPIKVRKSKRKEALIKRVSVELHNIHNTTVFIDSIDFTPHLRRGPRSFRISKASLEQLSVTEQRNSGMGSVRPGERVMLEIDLVQNAGEFSLEDYQKQSGSVSGALFIKASMRVQPFKASSDTTKISKSASFSILLPISYACVSGGIRFPKSMVNFKWDQRSVVSAPTPIKNAAKKSNAALQMVDGIGASYGGKYTVIRRNITITANTSHDLTVTGVAVRTVEKSVLSSSAVGGVHEGFAVTYSRSKIPAGFRGVVATVDFIPGRLATALQATSNTPKEAATYPFPAPRYNNTPNTMTFYWDEMNEFVDKLNDRNLIEHATLELEVGTSKWSLPIEAETGVPLLSSNDVDFGVVEVAKPVDGRMSTLQQQQQSAAPHVQYVTLRNSEPYPVQVQYALMSDLFDTSGNLVSDSVSLEKFLKYGSQMDRYRQRMRTIKKMQNQLSGNNGDGEDGTHSTGSASKKKDSKLDRPSDAFFLSHGGAVITIPAFGVLERAIPVYYKPKVNSGSFHSNVLVLRTNRSTFDLLSVRATTGQPMLSIVDPQKPNAERLESLDLNVTMTMVNRWVGTRSAMGPPTFSDLLHHVSKGAPTMDLVATEAPADAPSQTVLATYIARGQSEAAIGGDGSNFAKHPIKSRQNIHFQKVVNLLNNGMFPIEVHSIRVGGHECGNRNAVQLSVYPCVTTDARLAADRRKASVAANLSAATLTLPSIRLEPQQVVPIRIIYEPNFVLSHQSTNLEVIASALPLAASTDESTASAANDVAKKQQVYTFSTSVSMYISVPVESLKKMRNSNVHTVHEMAGHYALVGIVLSLLVSFGGLTLVRSVLPKQRFQRYGHAGTPSSSTTSSTATTPAANTTPRESGTSTPNGQLGSSVQLSSSVSSSANKRDVANRQHQILTSSTPGSRSSSFAATPVNTPVDGLGGATVIPSIEDDNHVVDGMSSLHFAAPDDSFEASLPEDDVVPPGLDSRRSSIESTPLQQEDSMVSSTDGTPLVPSTTIVGSNTTDATPPTPSSTGSQKKKKPSAQEAKALAKLQRSISKFGETEKYARMEVRNAEHELRRALATQEANEQRETANRILEAKVAEEKREREAAAEKKAAAEARILADKKAKQEAAAAAKAKLDAEKKARKEAKLAAKKISPVGSLPSPTSPLPSKGPVAPIAVDGDDDHSGPVSRSDTNVSSSAGSKSKPSSTVVSPVRGNRGEDGIVPPAPVLGSSLSGVAPIGLDEEEPSTSEFGSTPPSALASTERHHSGSLASAGVMPISTIAAIGESDDDEDNTPSHKSQSSARENAWTSNRLHQGRGRGGNNGSQRPSATATNLRNKATDRGIGDRALNAGDRASSSSFNERNEHASRSVFGTGRIPSARSSPALSGLTGAIDDLPSKNVLPAAVDEDDATANLQRILNNLNVATNDTGSQQPTSVSNNDGDTTAALHSALINDSDDDVTLGGNDAPVGPGFRKSHSAQDTTAVSALFAAMTGVDGDDDVSMAPIGRATPPALHEGSKAPGATSAAVEASWVFGVDDDAANTKEIDATKKTGGGGLFGGFW